MNDASRDKPALKPGHRGMAIRGQHALPLVGILILSLCLVGAYPAVLGALLLAVAPVLYCLRAKAASIASFLPLPLAIVGGIVGQSAFGGSHLAIRILLGVAAGVIIGLTLSVTAMILESRSQRTFGGGLTGA